MKGVFIMPSDASRPPSPIESDKLSKVTESEGDHHKQECQVKTNEAI